MIPVHFRSFETRIVVFFFVLLTAVQVAAFLIVGAANETIARRELASQIRVGERVFGRTLEQNGRQLEQIVAMLASDPSFRDALDKRNSTTIAAVLRQHGERIKAGLVMLVDLDNRLLADSTHDDRIGKPFPFPELVGAAGQTQRASAVVIIDNQPYQLVVVPALAPRPIAWVAMGFKIDDALAEEIRALTTLQVSFLTELGERQWQISASTLPSDERDQLSGRVAELILAQARDLNVAIGEQNYQTRVITVTKYGGERVIAVLQKSLKNHLNQHLGRSTNYSRRLSISQLPAFSLRCLAVLL